MSRLAMIGLLLLLLAALAVQPWLASLHHHGGHGHVAAPGVGSPSASGAPGTKPFGGTP
jgi:hypothetical protein